MAYLFQPKTHVGVVREIFRLMRQHRTLIAEMVKRDITDIYAGQVLGTFWIVIHPLVRMALFVFLFAIVLQVRVGEPDGLPRDYTTFLLAGLIPWLAFMETMGKSAVTILSSASLVKQLAFPTEILPVKAVLASMIPFGISWIALLMYALVRFGALPMTAAWLPVLILLQMLAMIGIAFLFSSVGVFFRDLKDIVQAYGVLSVYLLPILYDVEMVPAVLRPIIYINPFSYMVWSYQDALYHGAMLHPWAWVINALLSVGLFYVGYLVFRKLKPHFGNVL